MDLFFSKKKIMAFVAFYVYISCILMFLLSGRIYYIFIKVSNASQPVKTLVIKPRLPHQGERPAY